MTSDLLKRLRGRLGGEGELQIDPPPQADYKWCTSSRNLGLCLSQWPKHSCGITRWTHPVINHDTERQGGGAGAKTLNPSIHLTLFEGPLVRVGSSYAATFSHVATTACVGVNLASGNPRCTSWVSRWMNEWWKWSKKRNKMECTMDWTNGWTEKRKEFRSVVNYFSERIHLNMSFSEFLFTHV